MEGLAAGAGIFWLFLVILAILWCLIPFAIFGIKPLLKQLLAEQRRTANGLEKLLAATPQRVDLPEHIPPKNPGDNRTLGEIMTGR